MSKSATFQAVTGNFGIFAISSFPPNWVVQIFGYIIFALFAKIWSKTYIAPPKAKITIWHCRSRDLEWLWLGTRSSKACESTIKYHRHDPSHFIGFVSSWYGYLARRSQRWQVLKKLNFGLTYDIISDIQIAFLHICRIFMPGAIKCHFQIEN